MKIYEKIVSSDWKFRETPDKALRIESRTNTIFVPYSYNDYSFLRDLAMHFVGKNTYKKLFTSPNKVHKAVAETAVAKWLQLKVAPSLKSDVTLGESLKDKVIYSLIHGISVEEMQKLGIEPNLADIVDKVNTSLTPEGVIAPAARLNNACVVLDELLREEEAPKEADGEPFSSKPPEDIKREKKDAEAPKNPRTEASREKATPSVLNPSEVSRLIKELKKSEEEYEEVKKNAAGNIFNVAAVPQSLFKDAEDTIEKPSVKYQEGYSLWCKLIVMHPPLNSFRFNKAFNSKRSSDSGSVPVRFTDPASGKYFRESGRSLGYTRGATVVVDVSGSTCFSEKNIASLIRNFPLSTIAVYAGPAKNKGRGYGGLAIIAKNGRYVGKYTQSNYFDSCQNLVDGPAINWLSTQRGPRIFISDLAFRGEYDQYVSPATFDKAMNNLRVMGAVVLAHPPTQKMFLSTGKISMTSWKDNSKILADFDIVNNNKDFNKNVLVEDSIMVTIQKALQAPAQIKF